MNSKEVNAASDAGRHGLQLIDANKTPFPGEDMPLASRVHTTFVEHEEQPLFEFFSSSYPRTISDEFRSTVDSDLENAIEAELVHYPSLGRKIATYTQVYPWVMHLGKVVAFSTQAGDLIGLSVQDHAFWYTAEFSVVGVQRGAVGAYSGWPAQDIFDAWELSKVSMVILDPMVLNKLIESQLKWPDTIKKIILMSKEPVELSLYSSLSSKIELESMVIDYFSSPQVDLKAVPICEEIASKQFDENNPALVIFTSGTSGGKPKGLVYSHQKWDKSKPNYRSYSKISVHEPSWSTGKHSIWGSFLSGGKISFIPNGSHLFEINRMVRPGSAVFVPIQARELYTLYLDFLGKEKERLSNGINKSEAIKTKTGVKLTSFLRKYLPIIKNKKQKENRLPRPKDINTQVDIDTQANINAIHYVYEYLLGGRVKLVTVGGAAVSTEILTFLKKLPCRIYESYGQTESRGILSNGYPTEGKEIKLVSLPDMGYSTEDNPYPRGEIAVKSSGTMPENNWICDEAQRRSIQQRYTKDGFLLTGDIAEVRPDGRYVIIDRVSSLQKLENGKFISPERIENVISPQSITLESGFSPSACFVTLNASRSATIVMFRFEEPIEEKYRIKLEQELASKVKSACRMNSIPESEIPLKVIIDDSNDGGWSLENGVLNRAMKVVRHMLQARLENIIAKQSTYTPINATSAKDYPKTPVALASWLFHKLQPEVNSFDERMLESLFVHIGFDSMQFTKMGVMLPELLNELHTMGCVNIKEDKHFATPILMKHSMLTLAQTLWNENPEESLAKKPKQKEISLLDRLTEIEKNSMEQLQQLKDIPYSDSPKTKRIKQQDAIPANKKRVFVTGGAGFLGAHIIRDLLNDPTVSEVICLVRGSGKEEAASRVRRIVLTGHESLSQMYLQKIKVVDGDLSKDKFGLQASDYETLIHDGHGNPAIDTIIHAAAMIKTWKLEEGLDTLTEPNVQGTLRIAQLAFETSQYRDNQQLTPVVYVSSNSVHCDEVCSQDEIRRTHPEGWFAIFKDEAAIKRNLNAYAATKWMGEQILRESGLPVTIVRAPLLTWNTKTGYGNDDDWLNRLVDACVSTKKIPQFDSEASVRSMPVNQCSALIVQIVKDLIENVRNNPFSIEYPYQGVPGLSLYCMFKKLAEQAQANGMNMTPVSVATWGRELESMSHTHPTRFHPLLTMLLGISKKRSGVQEVSQMEGVEPWLQSLLSTYIKKPASAAVLSSNSQNDVRIGLFNHSMPQRVSQIMTPPPLAADQEYVRVGGCRSSFV